jgi:hypothetical protein
VQCYFLEVLGQNSYDCCSVSCDSSQGLLSIAGSHLAFPVQIPMSCRVRESLESMLQGLNARLKGVAGLIFSVDYSIGSS